MLRILDETEDFFNKKKQTIVESITSFMKQQ